VGSRPAVSALLLRDHDDAVALAPGGQLLARGRPEGVPGGEEHGEPPGLEEARELRDGGGLARAVDARQQDHEGTLLHRRERALEGPQQLDERGLELGLELVPGLQALVAHGLAQRVDQVRGRRDAHVGSEQLAFERLVERLVDPGGAAQHADRAAPALARELQVLLQERLESREETFLGLVLLAEQGGHRRGGRERPTGQNGTHFTV
jgi:hypothetical protein